MPTPTMPVEKIFNVVPHEVLGVLRQHLDAVAEARERHLGEYPRADLLYAVQLIFPTVRGNIGPADLVTEQQSEHVIDALLVFLAFFLHLHLSIPLGFISLLLQIGQLS